MREAMSGAPASSPLLGILADCQKRALAIARWINRWRGQRNRLSTVQRSYPAELGHLSTAGLALARSSPESREEPKKREALYSASLWGSAEGAAG